MSVAILFLTVCLELRSVLGIIVVRLDRSVGLGSSIAFFYLILSVMKYYRVTRVTSNDFIFK